MEGNYLHSPRLYIALAVFLIINIGGRLIMRYFGLALPRARNWREAFLMIYWIYPKWMDRTLIRRVHQGWFVLFVLSAIAVFSILP